VSDAPRGKRHQKAQRKTVQIGLVHFAQLNKLLIARFGALAGGAALDEKVPNLDSLLRGKAVLCRPD
jgi:hypothetical protein